MGRDAKIDWKALSKRIGHADVAFTMRQYVQTDLEADRQVANTLAELIIGGALASSHATDETCKDQTTTFGGDSGEAASLRATFTNPFTNLMQEAPSVSGKGL